MKIEIKSTVVNERNVPLKDGRELQLFEQVAYLHQDHEEYPAKMQISHRKNTPLAPGFYTLSDSSYRVSRFGSLELDPYNLKYESISDNKVPETKSPLSFGKVA